MRGLGPTSFVTRRILINVPRLDVPGGVSNFFLVLCRHFGPDRQYFEIGARSGESGALQVLRRSLADYWRFHRRLASGEISLVHLNPSLVPKSVLRDALFLLIARAHAVPVLCFFHGWDADFQSLIERRFLRVFRTLLSRASAIVVLAEDYRRSLEHMGITKPVSCLTTLVDDQVFDEPLKSASSHTPHFEILYLSRLAPGKGVIETLQAYAILKRRVPYATLTIAGDGPEREPAEKLVAQLRVSGVRFVGHVDGDLKRSAFKSADVYLFPTFFGEGMPTTVLEAMAYGLPVVTRSVGGLRDFFAHGRMGLITDSRDPSDFAAMLLQLAGDPDLRVQIGAYNRRYAREHFAASVVAGRLEQIYAQVAK
jgi:glycosyltransferase involved in cell wall biosynthesis